MAVATKAKAALPVVGAALVAAAMIVRPTANART